jgi:glycerate kinase
VRVVVAPDSFKGSATATDAAAAIARGWRSVRPGDELRALPQADGGEGTLAALHAAVPGCRWLAEGWLELPDGRSVVELAAVCGLPLYNPKDPLGASTERLGQLLTTVLDRHAASIVVALGGSASTDGGTGALAALGARFLDRDGLDVAPGGGPLAGLSTIDLSALRRPPAGGVRLLTDVTSPLLGPDGAAAVFAPQKGASPAEVRHLEGALATLASLLGGNPHAPGSGAAGGTAYGLATAWESTISPGAAAIAQLTGLTDELARADVLVTGEGRFDDTSLVGKVVGYVLAEAGPRRLQRIVVAGSIVTQPRDAWALSLSELAGSAADAMAAPLEWLEVAGERAALLMGTR